MFLQQAPQQIEQYQLPIAGGAESIGVIVITGAAAGKTLLVTAGVHGCEYIGIEAVRALVDLLDTSQMQGRVILLPMVNRSGFFASAKQIVPEDGKNLNRVFPGQADGTLSQRIAYTIEHELYPHADLLVDLHGGDIHEEAMAFAYFPAQAASEVTEAARKAADSLSMSYRVASTAKDGLYSYAAQCGVPALLLERGGRGSCPPDQVQAYVQNILELMAHLSIIDRPLTIKAEQREISHAVYEEAVADGFWHCYVRAGYHFHQGALLGELRDEHGKILQTAIARSDGVVLYATVILGVSRHEPLIAYGQL